MKKIDLFHMPHPEVAQQDRNKIVEINQLMNKGKVRHIPTKWNHLFMMSKFFNFNIIPDDEHKISKAEHPVIYHIPDGTRTQIHPSVKSILKKYRGQVPIVMRSYDPHPPRKLGKQFMTDWHDLTITYLRSNENGDEIKFGRWGYDNHLFGVFNFPNGRNKLACMINSNRTEPKHNRSPNVYQKYDVNVKKTHDFRRKIAKHSSLDVFGSGWSANMNGYKGSPQPFDQKYQTLKKYKFNIIILPAIARDYIDEKILDSLITLTVPVVLGPSTLKNHIPQETFIDISDFSSINDLMENLENMSDSRYANYVDSIRNHRNDIFNYFSTKENYAKTIYDWYRNRYDGSENIGCEYENIEKEIKRLELQQSNNIIAEGQRIFSLGYDKIRHYYSIK